MKSDKRPEVVSSLKMNKMSPDFCSSSSLLQAGGSRLRQPEGGGFLSTLWGTHMKWGGLGFLPQDILSIKHFIPCFLVKFDGGNVFIYVKEKQIQAQVTFQNKMQYNAVRFSLLSLHTHLHDLLFCPLLCLLFGEINKDCGTFMYKWTSVPFKPNEFT